MIQYSEIVQINAIVKNLVGKGVDELEQFVPYYVVGVTSQRHENAVNIEIYIMSATVVDMNSTSLTIGQTGHLDNTMKIKNAAVGNIFRFFHNMDDACSVAETIADCVTTS